jgi:hypothetical protein
MNFNLEVDQLISIGCLSVSSIALRWKFLAARCVSRFAVNDAMDVAHVFPYARTAPSIFETKAERTR